MAAPLRVAVVGSGPAGFYAAGHLLDSGLEVEVDMLERLPTPWGLVRLGVAPDHPKIKAVSKAFEKIAAQPGFRFLGGVEVRDQHAGAAGQQEARHAHATPKTPQSHHHDTLTGKVHEGQFLSAGATGGPAGATA